jgi:hypothetical protein
VYHKRALDRRSLYWSIDKLPRPAGTVETVCKRASSSYKERESERLVKFRARSKTGLGTRGRCAVVAVEVQDVVSPVVTEQIWAELESWLKS